MGTLSSFSFVLLLLTTLVPLCNLGGVEDTEAATGTAQDSTITFTSTRTTASTDLTVNSTNGTFSSSTDGTGGTSDTRASFSLSTNNYTGYTLTIASSSSNLTSLSDGNGNEIESLPSTVTAEGINAETFNTTTYNNKWGYKPSYKNSTLNSNFFPSPIDDATTLDITETANTEAKAYTIELGVRADYTLPSGTYNNTNTGTNSGNTFTLAYVANPVTYAITYDPNTTDSTLDNMPYADTTPTPYIQSGNVSSTSITLSNLVPTRTTYDFTGWCKGTIIHDDTTNTDSCTGTIYNPNGDGTNLTYGIDKTTANEPTIYAMWSIKTFTLTVQNGGNTTVTGSGTYKYGETVTITATPTSNTTCTTYATPSWSKTSGEGTLNATSGSSVTFAMGLGDATVKATSDASNVAQTITLTKGTGVNGITIAGTKYTGTSVSLNCGTYAITAPAANFNSGYEFSSWARANGVAITSTTTASTNMTVTGAGILTLNAKKTYMQSMAYSNCTTTAKTAYDSRDETPYVVQRLADGKCWMLENLAFDAYTNRNTMTVSNTNAEATALTRFINGGGTTSDRYPTSAIASSWTSSYSYSVPLIKTGYETNTVIYAKGVSGSNKIGTYYNYCAASAGYYCYGNGTSSGSPSGNSTYDICPYGWRLPTGGSNGEFQALYTAYSSNATNYVTALRLPLSGYVTNGSQRDAGSGGYFWSSTYYSASDMHSLYAGASSMELVVNDGRRYGFSVRCVKSS